MSQKGLFNDYEEDDESTYNRRFTSHENAKLIKIRVRTYKKCKRFVKIK